MCALAVATSFQDLLNLDVVGTEAAVELEVVCVVQERPAQGEEQLLQRQTHPEKLSVRGTTRAVMLVSASCCSVLCCSLLYML